MSAPYDLGENSGFGVAVPDGVPANLHDLDLQSVISDELVACTLGRRSRPELRVDIVGRLWHALRAFRDMVAPLIPRTDVSPPSRRSVGKPPRDRGVSPVVSVPRSTPAHRLPRDPATAAAAALMAALVVIMIIGAGVMMTGAFGAVS